MEENNNVQEIRKKICLLGDSAVGKTSLIAKYVYDVFDESYITTMGTKVSKKVVSLDNSAQDNMNDRIDVTLAIWDVIGQHQYHTLVLKYFKNAKGGLVVADATRPETIVSMRNWIGSFFNTVGKVPIVLLINKCDLLDVKSIDKKLLEEYSIEFGTKYLFTSAKTGENVEEAFKTLTEQIVKDTQKEKEIESLVQVADAMIVDFCSLLGGFESGMPIVDTQFKKAGVEFMNPTKGQLIKALENLANVATDIHGKDIAQQQIRKFRVLLNKF
jgi:small GTP-binding protein